MRGVRLVAACGLLLALPLIAAAQSESDPTPTEVVEPTADEVDPTVPTTRTIELTGVESPFAAVSVADTPPSADEVLPSATPEPREKLPPGPATRKP